MVDLVVDHEGAQTTREVDPGRGDAEPRKSNHGVVGRKPHRTRHLMVHWMTGIQTLQYLTTMATENRRKKNRYRDPKVEYKNAQLREIRERIWEMVGQEIHYVDT